MAEVFPSQTWKKLNPYILYKYYTQEIIPETNKDITSNYIKKYIKILLFTDDY